MSATPEALVWTTNKIIEKHNQRHRFYSQFLDQIYNHETV